MTTARSDLPARARLERFDGTELALHWVNAALFGVLIVTAAHGGPARLYVAPMYGYKSIKWLETIEVSEAMPQEGYWEVRGYDTDAWIGRSNNRDDRPA